MKDAAMEVDREETVGLDVEIPIAAASQQKMEQCKYIMEMGKFSFSYAEKQTARNVENQYTR